MLVHFFFDLLLWTFLLGTSHNGSIFSYLNSWNSCIQCKNIPVNGSGAIQSRTQEIIHKAMASSGMPRCSPLHNPSMAPTKAKVYPALSRSLALSWNSFEQSIVIMRESHRHYSLRGSPLRSTIQILLDSFFFAAPIPHRRLLTRHRRHNS